MNGNRPDGNDFNFNINGYQCALGLNDLNYTAGGTMFEYRLVKMKHKSTTPSPDIADWEHVHSMELSLRQSEDPKILLQEFVAEANPILALKVGGEIPPVPETFIERCKWLCQFFLGFDAATGSIFVK